MTTTAHTGDPVAATLAAYDANPDQYASRWDGFTVAPGGVDLVALLTAHLPAGARVLDLGSGSGRDLRRLRRAGFDATGVDATGVDASGQLAARARRSGPVVVADMRQLPFDDHSIDAILAAASLLHLPSAAAAEALAHIARVLRIGGRLVLSVKAGTGTTTDGAGRFFHLYDDDSLDALVTGAGLRIDARYTDTTDARAGTTWLVRVATR